MNDEIDLGKIILDLWEGKWKIITSTLIAFTIGLALTFPTSQPSYQAITEIRPITSIDSRKYNQLNSFDFLKVTPTSNDSRKYNQLNSFDFLKVTPQNLLNLYIEQVEYKSIFIDAIKDLEIYKKSDFETEEDYDNAILRLASRIEILFPNDNEKK